MSWLDKTVRDGAKFLDTNSAGCIPRDWRDRINLDRLDLQWVDRCLIGQIFGNYYSSLSDMGIDDEEAKSLGFDVTDAMDYEALTQAWKDYLSGAGKADRTAAEEIVSLLDGMTLKQLRKNKKVIKKALKVLESGLTL